MRPATGEMSPWLLLSLFSLVSGTYVSPFSSEVKIRVNTTRNDTGHWITKLEMQHGTNIAIGKYKLKASHITVQKDSFNITLTPPPLDMGGLVYEGGLRARGPLSGWDAARRACQLEGAHLAVPRAAADLRDLALLLAAADLLPPAYVGAVRDGRFNYRTVQGESVEVTPFNMWPKPQSQTDERSCVVVNQDASLSLKTCMGHFSFICQLDEL